MRDSLAMKKGTLPQKSPDNTAWRTAGWLMVALGAGCVLVGCVKVSGYHPDLFGFVLLYGGGGLIPFGMLIACLGSVIRELSKISLALNSPRSEQS